MIPTEIQRIVLLIGLAAVGYMMILAWNDDFNGKTDAAPYTSAPLVQGDETNALLPAEQLAGTPEPSTTSSGNDLADESLLQDDAGRLPATVNSTAPAVKAGQLIEVVTPVLKVWIDRAGGDIVRVQLPQHPLNIEQPDIPLQLLDRSTKQTYIAQSGLQWLTGPGKGAPRRNFTSKQSKYELTPGQDTLTVTLTAQLDGIEITKEFVFTENDYLVNVNFNALNNTGAAVEAKLVAQIKRDDRDPPGEDSFSLGPQPYVGAALTTAESRYEKLEFDTIDDDGVFDQYVDGGWMAFLQHYFISAWIGNPEDSNRFFGKKNNAGLYVFGYISPGQSVAPGAQAQWHSRFYAGPKDQKRLEEIAPNLNLTVDYGFLWWLAVPLFGFLSWLHGVVGNWGVAIMLLTFMVKLVLYPLSAAAYRSTANMRRVAPQMKRLQERYSDNRQKLSGEMMALYKKEGVNPLGGCLPMLLPMPIFLALYWVLYESVELRHAPFMLWIDDLAAMDPLFVLPLLMGVSMFFQMSLTPQMGDPMQQKMMKMMPVMFTVLFLFFPAGLVLYWLVNNVLSIAQQYYVIRQAEAAAAAKA